MLRSRIGKFALLAGLALMLTGCGYALAGKGDNLPASIRIIGVPQFVNHSTVPDLEVALTDAVRTEFQSHGRYTTVPEAAGADAVLTATIRSVSISPKAFVGRQASRYAATVTASVEFKDTSGKILWSNANAQFSEEYDVTTSTNPNDASNFFGQDRTALQRLAKNFAQSIVTSILQAF